LYKISPPLINKISYLNNESYSPLTVLNVVGFLLYHAGNDLPENQREYNIFEKNICHFPSYKNNSETRFTRIYYFNNESNYYKVYILLYDFLPELYIDTYTITPIMNFKKEQDRKNAALRMIDIIKSYNVNSLTRYWDIKYKLGVLECIGYTKESENFLRERLNDQYEHEQIKWIIDEILKSSYYTNSINYNSS
jgi:hypothetical protein